MREGAGRGWLGGGALDPNDRCAAGSRTEGEGVANIGVVGRVRQPAGAPSYTAVTLAPAVAHRACVGGWPWGPGRPKRREGAPRNGRQTPDPFFAGAGLAVARARGRVPPRAAARGGVAPPRRGGGRRHAAKPASPEMGGDFYLI